jgi:hypothetical protein
MKASPPMCLIVFGNVNESRLAETKAPAPILVTVTPSMVSGTTKTEEHVETQPVISIPSG